MYFINTYSASNRKVIVSPTNFTSFYVKSGAQKHRSLSKINMISYPPLKLKFWWNSSIRILFYSCCLELVHYPAVFTLNWIRRLNIMCVCACVKFILFLYVFYVIFPLLFSEFCQFSCLPTNMILYLPRTIEMVTKNCAFGGTATIAIHRSYSNISTKYWIPNRSKHASEIVPCADHNWMIGPSCLLCIHS